jgi:hypothetical protein
LLKATNPGDWRAWHIVEGIASLFDEPVPRSLAGREKPYINRADVLAVRLRDRDGRHHVTRGVSDSDGDATGHGALDMP